MISVHRQYAPGVFGPQSSPLYYTALSQAPRRLAVAGLSGDHLCHLIVTLCENDTRQQWSLPSRPVNGICIWPLTVIPARVDNRFVWRIEERGGLTARSGHADSVSQSSPPYEGCFRLLDAPCRERLLRGKQRLARGIDGNLNATAGALFLAELGLYHEALLMVEGYLKAETRRGNLLLARTVQTLIYKQMLRQIEQEQQEHATGRGASCWHLIWTQNRERYHREMTVAMMRGRCPGRCLQEVASS